MDWAAEGYELWMAVRSKTEETKHSHFSVLNFLKSALTVNPSMSQNEHLYLQGEDRVLINRCVDSNVSSNASKGRNKQGVSSVVGNSKNWVVILFPNMYISTNWPIRVCLNWMLNISNSLFRQQAK